MSSDFSQTMLIGRLGKDPIKSSDNAPCKFSIATAYKPKNGDEKTEWHNICAFGKLGETCMRFLKKGRLVHVVGRNSTTRYEKNGVTHYSTEVIADVVGFMDNPNSGQGNNSYQGNQNDNDYQGQQDTPPINDDTF